MMLTAWLVARLGEVFKQISDVKSTFILFLSRIYKVIGGLEILVIVGV